VALSDVTCGPATAPNVVVGGRDVMIDYPCDKPAGTPVTFILNLHGTQAVEDGKFYQHVYFAAYNYVDSHDFVVATPRAIDSQWGNRDNGEDLPHLQEVIDWVYESFSDFDIQSMWVVGHSWGSAYTLGFACREDLADKVKGVVLMSGGAGMPECADRLSVMATVGETDIVPGQPDQTATATAHGCGAMTTSMVGNNVVTEWPDCDAGWVHKNYLMLGKGHGFNPVDWPEEAMATDMMDSIRSTIE
jgi:pimeloyl-ACP methyl ester carboxylesterase